MSNETVEPEMRNVNPLQAELSHRLLNLFQQQGLSAGDHLAERELAEHCGVSRSPIRAALKLLEHAGVVSPRTQGGYQMALAAAELATVELALPQSPLDELYVQVGQDRVQGTLDEHITEADLLRRYQVPKALLNKVLAQLASEGLLQPAQGKGWNFTSLISCANSNQASYELRLALEPTAIRLDGFKPEPRRFQQALDLHRRLVDGLVFDINPHRLLSINADFHQMLVDFSGNQFFQENIRQQNRMRRFTESAAVLYPERMQQSCQEHLDIMEAIDQGDRNWAATLMERHLSISGNGKLGVPTADSKES